VTWQELVAFLRRVGHVELAEAHCCGVRITVAGQPRKVAVKLASDEVSVIVVAPVCPLSYLDPRRALEHNNAVEHWSLALEGERYVLRRTLPLPSLSEAELDAVLRVAAVEAARLQGQVQPPPSGLDSPFAHWADQP
jgi:hypothetical protein